MMLVELPAMDAVAVSVNVRVPWPQLPPSLATAARILARPSLWLVLLATLVILSSIRAAFLYIRPTPLHKVSVSLVVASPEKAAPSIPVPTPSADASSSAPGSPQPRPTTSWFWGLVKWDSLPALPVATARGWVQHQVVGMGVGVGSVRQQQQQMQMQQVQPRGRRGPAFDHPMPALYQSGPPVSMAKMIMSRHTFRRPSSRPPPVRSSNAVQYQRRSPSMV